MAGNYGDFVARTVNQGYARVYATAYVPLTASGTNGDTSGTTPLTSRRQVRFHIKANPGGSLGIAYVAKNADGTFTVPTDDAKYVTVYPGGSIVVEPIGDAVNVYAKLIKKAGYTGNHVIVAITEYR